MPSLIPNNAGTPYAFATELFIMTAVYCIHLEKRKLFPLRLLLTYGIFCLVAFLWSLAPDEIWIDILKYLSFYLILFLSAFFDFKLKWLGCIFVATVGYTSQHLEYKVSQLLFALLITVIDGFEDQVTIMIILYAVVVVLSAVAAYFIFGRQIKKGQTQVLENKFNIGASTILLTLVTAISAIFEDQCDPIGKTMLYGAGSAYDIVACAAMIFLLFRVAKQREKEEDYKKAEALWEREKDQLRTSKENMDYLRILAHDLKHEVEGALSSGKESERLLELGQSLDDFGKTLVTGNDALDVVLAERKTRMDKENVELTCIADGKALDFVASSDIYSLFVNLIDNAVDAVSKIEEKQRTISLSIQQKMGLVFIHEENPCAIESTFDEEGKPVTTNKDNVNHGLGTKSIELVANKYGGNVTFAQNGEIFSVDIVLDPASVEKQG